MRERRPGPSLGESSGRQDTWCRMVLMSEETSELLRKALTLPVAERAELAGSLIESLDEAKDKRVEAAWEEEIARRMEELDSGKVEPVSLDEARRRLTSAIE
jgi:putative addiction module component (TIGR02574 family)